MEQSVIEKTDRRCYNAILWQTVSFAVWFGAMLAASWIRNNIVIGISAFFTLAGVVVFFVCTLRLVRITKTITNDPEMRRAVNNEMFIAGDYKAGVWGYRVCLIAATIVFIITYYIQLPGTMVAGIILYVSVLSAKIAQLVIHRNR